MPRDDRRARPHEYEQGHVPGALSIPRGVLDIKLRGHEVIPDPDTPICVYCGIKGWKGAGLSAETAAESDEEE